MPMALGLYDTKWASHAIFKEQGVPKDSDTDYVSAVRCRLLWPRYPIVSSVKGG